MRRIRNGIISIITMILVMSSFGFCLTYAEPVNQDQITKEATIECNEEIAISADHVKTTDGFVIEPDQAFTIAMLFVAGNTERMQWDGTTSIREVVPLIDEDGDVEYYYVGLNTTGHPSGYANASSISGVFVTWVHPN